MSRNDTLNKLTASCNKGKHYPLAGTKNFGMSQKRSKYSNLTLSNSPAKEINFGSGGNRQKHISLAKVNLPEEYEE